MACYAAYESTGPERPCGVSLWIGSVATEANNSILLQLALILLIKSGKDPCLARTSVRFQAAGSSRRKPIPVRIAIDAHT